MGREVFESELDDRESLIYELVSRISKTAYERLALRIPPRKITVESLTFGNQPHDCVELTTNETDRKQD